MSRALSRSIVFLVLVSFLLVQTPINLQAQAAPPMPTPQELDQLLAPVALYPGQRPTGNQSPKPPNYSKPAQRSTQQHSPQQRPPQHQNTGQPNQSRPGPKPVSKPSDNRRQGPVRF